MGSSDDYARMRSLEYGEAVHRVGLKPGDVAALTCPSCQAAFFLELPVADPRVRLPVVSSDGGLLVTCANHCFTPSYFAEFQPGRATIPPSDWIESVHCTRYWTDTPASRCPLCGTENYREVLNRQVLKVQALDDGNQDAVIGATKDLVAIFDGVMRAMVRGHVANLVHALSRFEHEAVIEGSSSSDGNRLAEFLGRWPESVSFQNLPGARKNLLEATCECVQWHRGAQVEVCSTGSDIQQWITNKLGADAWHDLTRVFQKRHLYQHGLGAADRQYIERTGDGTVRIGQIVPIRADEVEVAAQACAYIANRFFAANLS